MIKQVLLFVITFVVGGLLVLGGLWVFHSSPVQKILSPNPPSQFSLSNAPEDSLKANVISLSGDVEWQSRTADTPVPLAQPKELQQGEQIATGNDGHVQFVFPNLATISLSPNATTNIIQTLPTSLVIQQTKGTVQYEVTSTEVPFSVRGLDLLMTIYGSTTVSVDPDKTIVTITVNGGSATLAYNDTQNVSQIVTVKKGQSVKFNNNTKLVVGL